MASAHDPISAVVDHVDAVGTTFSRRRKVSRWHRSEPLLEAFTSAGEAAAACRSARGTDQDRLVELLLGVAERDELAQLTVVAGLADRLGWVLAGWARAGVATWELPVLGTELVSECWAATAAMASAAACGGAVPDRVAWRLVDAAREAVRVPRRRQRRASARLAPITCATPLPASGPPGAEVLAAEIADAVGEGRITRVAAVPVFLTRVVGFSVAEAAQRLDCTPAVLRATRSRAERRLAAA